MIVVHFSFAEKKSGQKRKPVGGGAPDTPAALNGSAVLATSSSEGKHRSCDDIKQVTSKL